VPLVEGIQGAESIRFCEICKQHTLQLVGSFYDFDEEGHILPGPTRFSHLPDCPVCSDKLLKGEPINGNPTGDGVGGVRGESLDAEPRLAEDAVLSA